MQTASCSVLWCLVLFWALNLSAASAQVQTDSEAVVSFIEDLADPEAVREDPRRLIAFVEMIHKPTLAQCQQKGFQDCPRFEVYSPILPEGVAVEYEKVLVRAWLRLVVRTSLRLQLDTGVLSGTAACAAGWFDLTWYLYTSELLFPKEDFCDGYSAADLLPKCFLECDIPLDGSCPIPNSKCLECIAQRYAESTQTLYTVYYPDYLKTVTAALFEKMPTGIVWGDLNRLEFSFTQPVGSLNLNLSQVLEISRQAQSQDLRGAAYFNQGGAYAKVCQPSVALLGQDGKRLLELLRTLPGESLNVENPGLQQLEQLKRGLANRESAGDSAERTLRAILRWDEGELNPKYARGSANNLLNPFADLSPARNGTTTPTQYGCLGYVTLFKVWPKTETKTIGGGARLAACWGIPPLTVAPVPPLVLAAPRLHTDWAAVPEGYPIPGVKGAPSP